MSLNDLTGQKFGRWLVVERSSVIGHNNMWRCICDCGTEKDVRGSSLTGGISTSCGCWRKESVGNRARKHGDAGNRLYAIWDSMRQRCNNPNCHAYHNYGGRGISICDEWSDYAAFRRWAYESGYSELAARGKCTLDRMNVNEGYSPDNCRWVDMKAQSQNRRDSILLEYNGQCMALSDWADKVGLDYTTLWKRYRQGLSPEDILRSKS